MCLCLTYRRCGYDNYSAKGLVVTFATIEVVLHQRKVISGHVNASGAEKS